MAKRDVSNLICYCGSGKKFKKCCMETELGLLFNSETVRYLSDVQQKTKREICFEFDPPMNPGMSAAFSFKNGKINIGLSRKFLNSGRDISQSIAHEATHGLLLFGEKYGFPKIKEGVLINKEEANLSSIVTMIDDIVDNYIIYQQGFGPFHEHYINTVKNETESIKKGLDPYVSMKIVGPIFYKRFKTSRYVMAWAFLEFFSIDNNIKETLESYCDSFKEHLVDEYVFSEKNIEIIKNNDIFTRDGHDIILKEIIKLWDLDKKIELNWMMG